MILLIMLHDVDMSTCEARASENGWVASQA